MKIKSEPLNVLIAEDNLTNQLILRAYLSNMKHRSTIANNGMEALKISKENNFDCILMDLQMPEMNGIEATKKIRKFEKASGKHLPIIAVSAYSHFKNNDEFLEAGIDEFISKPIDLDLLKSILNNVTNKIY